MAGHALLSPSAAARWLHCTPSALLEARCPEQSSRYSEEGTAAHALAALKLKRALGMGYGSEARELKTLGGYVDEAMQRHTTAYARFVLERCAAVMEREGAAPRVDIERTVNPGIEGCYGTADALILGRREVHVIDLKYGTGVAVTAEGNPQLGIYGCGALELAPGAEEVHLAIYQPRRNNISGSHVSAAALRRWLDEEVRPAARRAIGGTGWQQPGTWCRFCRAAGSCLALTLMSLDAAGLDKASSLLPPRAVKAALDVLPVVEMWARAVRRNAPPKDSAAASDFDGFPTD